MRLSVRAIEICKRQLGVDKLQGFDDDFCDALENIGPEDIETDITELLENGIMDFNDGDLHVSALGQHVFSMMEAPEIFIMIDNIKCDKCVRLYIRNTYYLCILEDKRIEENNSYERYSMDLLPLVDLLVSAIAYGFKYDKDEINNTSCVDYQGQDIHIERKVWNVHSNSVQEEIMQYAYLSEAEYIVKEKKNTTDDETESEKQDICSVINEMIMWLLENMRALEGEEEK